MNHNRQTAGHSHPSSPRILEPEAKSVINLTTERSRMEAERRGRTLRYQDLPLIGPNRLAVDYLKAA
jgi:hypothetical protein